MHASSPEWYLVFGRKLVFLLRHAAPEVSETTGVLFFSAATPDFQKNAIANDTASVGLGWRFQVGWRQAASGSRSRRVRCRASNSRPMTCRL